MAKANKNAENAEQAFIDFATRKPQLSILTDQPLSGQQIKALFKEDPFNLRYKLGPVYDIIRHKKPKAKTEQMPTAVLITGDWGTGKTTAMRWLEVLLNQWNKSGPAGRTRVRPLWFYPWKYDSKDDVRRGLIASVILNAIDVRTANWKTVRKALKLMATFVGKSTLDLLEGQKISVDGFEISGSAIKKIIKNFKKAAHPEKPYLNPCETVMETWVKDSLGKDQRMVIFIDDLDRCMPEVALVVLESLKLYLNIPNLIFVLGVDRQVIQKLVLEHYKKLGLVKEKDKEREEEPEEKQARTRAERKARQYLSKMFQTEIELSPSQKQIADFFEKQLKDITLWDESLAKKHDKELDDKALFERLVLKFARRNLRELKRQLNNALMAGAGTEMIDVKQHDDKPTFQQGVQLYFIREILKGYTLISDMIDTDPGRRFFKDWSDLAIAYKDIPESDKYPEGASDEEQSERESSLSDELAERDLSYQSEQYLQLLNDPDLRSLMVIPFSEKLAEFTTQTPTAGPTRPSEAAFAPEEAVEMKEPPGPTNYVIVRDAVARQLNKVPQFVTPQDYIDITKLNLSRSGITHLAPLREFTNLQSLSLYGTQVADIGPLAFLTNLKLLSLTHTKVADIGPLAGLTNLQELLLHETSVSNLEPLRNLTALLRLGVNQTPVSGLEPLENLTGLQALDIEKTKVSDVAHLRRLTSLVRLYLSGTQVADIGPLTSLTNLQRLDLSRTQVGDIGPLASLTNLQELLLHETSVSNLEPLRNLTALVRLGVNQTPVSDLEPLQNLTRLQALDLNETKASDVAPLRNLTALLRLYLLHTEVADVGPLAQLTNLQLLFLSDTQVADIGPLASLANLQELIVDGTAVADVGPLKWLTNLQELSLTNTQVADIGPLASLTKLRRLWLNGTQVADIGPLAQLTNLKTLYLTKGQFSDEQIAEVKKALPKLQIGLIPKPE